MYFVFIHGSYGNSKNNWFPAVKKDLEQRGHSVLIPEFPVDTWESVTANGPQKSSVNQTLSHWFEIFDPIAKTIGQTVIKPMVIAHSLGPLFVLHATLRFQIQWSGGIFVAPFLEKLGCAWQIDVANESFYKKDFPFGVLKKYMPYRHVFYSRNDPYVQEKFSVDFAELFDCTTTLIANAGHFNSESGFIDFPELTDKALELLYYPKIHDTKK